MEMGSSHTSLSSLPSLLCEEDQSIFSPYNDKDENFCHIFEYDDDGDEFIENLVHKDAALQSNVGHLFASDNSVKMTECWLKCARLHAVKWILDTRAFLGFHFQTVYLSLIYFDRFFSKRSIEVGKLWAIRLLSVACLSLAAKMEEYRAPALSEYHVNECNFESSVIQKMEVLVLETLEWKMNLSTPFDYFLYFITKFCGESRPKGLISRAIELTLGTVKEINLAKFPPSMIAAAAVLAACGCQTTKQILEFKMNVISSWGSSQKDHVLFCYNLMQEIQKAKSNTPNPHSPMNLTLKQSNSSDCLENSSIITSAVGTKRRLTYTNNNELQPLQKKHKL